MHYVYMPCSPLQGNRAYRSTIDDGMRLAAHLRAHLPDRAMPKFCTATAFGKIDWGPNGWAVEEDPQDRRYLWLRTPYTQQTFESFSTDVDLSGVARHNSEGTLDARFMVEVGDSRWLKGVRMPATRPEAATSGEGPGIKERLGRFAETARMGISNQDGALRRVSCTRAELDCASAHDDVAGVFDELASWKRVSDVVIWSSKLDPLRQPWLLERVIGGLAVLPNITAVRVRSHEAVIAPERLSRRELDVLFLANRLGAAAPLRIELELRILHESELTSRVGDLASRLRANGVTTYAITLLLAGVNADPEMVRGISSGMPAFWN